ncbi:MAG: hypothetical protein HC831_06950 [Chloroflexia bacterium]|nr:hypothetical protein [Chloroflexia bacterium]
MLVWCFNGTYLGSNSYSSQFASSFTHELGHF